MTHYGVLSGPIIQSCQVRMLSSIRTSSGIQAKGKGLFCSATRSFIRMLRVKESAIFLRFEPADVVPEEEAAAVAIT